MWKKRILCLVLVLCAALVMTACKQKETFPTTPQQPDAGQATDAPADQPNYCLTVTTYGLEFIALTHFDGEIKEGNIVAGEAWLYAEI